MGLARPLAYGAIVVSTLFGLFSRTEADPDLWGHIRFGLDIVRDGAIPRVDPYSYLSEGTPWINHEWAAEVALGLAWRSFETPGVVGLKVALCLSVVGIMGWRLYRRKVPWISAVSWLMLLVLLLLPGFQTARPQLFTFLYFTIVVAILEGAERGRVVPLGGLPIVFALWPNFHGGFLAGIAVTVVWLIGFVLGRALQPVPEGVFNRQLAWRIAAVGAGFAATLLNPYGIELLLFLWRTATVPRPEISEWAPLRLVSLEGAAYAVTMAIAVFALLRGGGWRRPALALPWAATACLPWMAFRHCPLFAIASGVLLADPLTRAITRLPTTTEPELEIASLDDVELKRHSLKERATAFDLVLLALSMLFAVSSLREWRCIRLPEEDDAYPQRAVAILKESGFRGNLAIMFNWGEYAIWHLGPDVKVSFDGRRETVYDAANFQLNADFMLVRERWDRLLTEHPTDAALVDITFPVYDPMLRREGWTAFHTGSRSLLCLPKSSPWFEKIEAAVVKKAREKPVAKQCFP